jgi:release factor glutamine methyltransferase
VSQSIVDLLRWARRELNSSELDADILLAHVLNVSRSYLLAFSERELTEDEKKQFEKLIAERKKKIPIAYLTGHREFWSLDFIVTSDTLIPRPETELLVELILQKMQGDNKTVADLGTGSGAIALAIAHERPSWKIYATDASEKALHIAKLNADRFNLKNVIFSQGSWCRALPAIKLDVIVSNPPYIAVDDPHLENLSHEPKTALIADDNGLRDFRVIIAEAKYYLQAGGLLLLEHGFNQADQVRKLLREAGYLQVETYQDLAGLERVSAALNC